MGLDAEPERIWEMKQLRMLTYLAVLTVFTPSVDALTGDLDLDGDVDFDDFFIFADQFGKEGPVDRVGVDTIYVTKTDTLERIIEREVTVRDTIVQTLLDTVILERTVRDTVVQVVTRIDTVINRVEVPVPTNEVIPEEMASWTDVVNNIRSSVYWIGYTAKPQGDTRYSITFVGTGFAVSPTNIVTNYHVGSAVNAGFANIRSDLEPTMIAVQAETRVYGDGTFFIGGVSERSLLGIWHPSYDRTVFSPDIAIFSAKRVDGSSVLYTDDVYTGGLDYLNLVTLNQAMDLEVGDEIAVLGFPGLLETESSPYELVPTPTFKSGTISAIRSFENQGFDSNWKRALLGKFIQHDIETSPGNSGSPLVNKRGQVVAIHNSGIPGGESYNFGIRADEIRLMWKALFFKSERPDYAQRIPRPSWE